MEEKKKKIILYGIAIILSLTLFIIIIHFLQVKDYFALLWICYITLVLILVGIIRKDSNLILSQIIILLIPSTIWIIDFIISTVNPKNLEIPIVFFNVGSFSQAILSILHIYTIIFALIALALLKIEKKSYKALLIGFIEIGIVFLLMILIPGNYGVNCLPTPVYCMVSITLPGFIPYPLFLLFSVSVFIMISYFVILSIPVFRKII